MKRFEGNKTDVVSEADSKLAGARQADGHHTPITKFLPSNEQRNSVDYGHGGQGLLPDPMFLKKVGYAAELGG